jgi:hypothetical protein
MKTFLVLFAAAACISMSHFVVEIKEDTSLQKLHASLPEGWLMRIDLDTLKIEHPDQMWVLKSNFINAPADAYENSEENRIKIMQHGSKTKAHFYFLVKSKKGLAKAELVKANYFSQKYALFQISADGFDTPYARYYPFVIEEEATRLYNVTLRDNLKVGVGPVYPEVDYSRP